jgi:hypothetical protein
LVGRGLWGFWGRERRGWLLQRAEARGEVGENEGDERFRGRACERRMRTLHLEKDCRPCEDIALLLRRGGGEGKTGLRGGKGSDDHEVSIPIRVGDGDRAGRTPSFRR